MSSNSVCNHTRDEQIGLRKYRSSEISVLFQRIFLVYLQVANAANYGAIAAIIYSDPADYAQQGGEPENTYPNTAWLPASGVQRGSLYTMPGNGDPQTPGIAALEAVGRSMTVNYLPFPHTPLDMEMPFIFLKESKVTSVFKHLRCFCVRSGHNRDITDI